MSGLTACLLSMFEDKDFVDMTDDEKTIAVIEFTMAALAKCGHEKSRIMGSGYLSEALMGAQNQLVVSKKPQGVDSVDKNGVPHEMKTSTVRLGGTASLHLFVPKYDKSSETVAEYYERVRAINAKKGNILFKHTYDVTDAGKELQNIYIIGHEFASFFMQHKKCHLRDDINMGADSCVKCTKIHRVVRLQELEKEWLADKEGFDAGKLDIAVPATCKK